MKFLTLIVVFAITLNVNAQTETLPYYEIPEYSETFTAGTVAARMVDGLGFRYYWSSHDLKDADLNYKPNADSRTVAETIDHILDLSYVIVNSTLKQANNKVDKEGMNFDAKRKQTLINLKTAADILRSSEDISEFEIVFGENRFPFWNQINGPIADAIWHCGQLASFRRTTGNPINSKISHFTGTIKE